MTFEDRVRAAAEARQREERAAAQAARDADAQAAAARDAARAMLPEVRRAIAAVQSAPTPPPRPATLSEEHSLHRIAWENVVDEFRWHVSRRLRVEKEGVFRPRWVCVFDSWHFSLGSGRPTTTILVRPGSAEVTYDTGEANGPWAARSPMSLEDFAELGLVSWNAGSWKDSSWPAGSLYATHSFDLFLDAAAALLAHLSP